MAAAAELDAIPQILEAIPHEWRGTTFANSHLLGRDEFSERLSELIKRSSQKGEKISSDDLTALGNAEDYLRVASNISTTLEYFLGLKRGLPVSQVFTFGSTRMPLVAVLLTSSRPVHIYIGHSHNPCTSLTQNLASAFQLKVEVHSGLPVKHESDDVVLALDSGLPVDWTPESVHADGVVSNDTLYILNTERIRSADILVIRKRMAIPITSPAALHRLELLSVSAKGSPLLVPPSEEEVNRFLSHLQELSGTDVDLKAKPVVFTAGLPSLCSFYVSLIKRGGVDVLLCSTAYGGSSQLTDIIAARAPSFKKHTYDVAGGLDLQESIQNRLHALQARSPQDRSATLVLFIETPTNPDMKVPDLVRVVAFLEEYGRVTGSKVMLLLDTTFAPNSNVLGKVRAVAPDLPALVFISMSKSVSRGHTVAGAIVANHTEEARSVLEDVREIAAALDTTVRDDQIDVLVRNHVGVEDRCDNAYATAVAAGEALQAAVLKHRSAEMPLAFVTKEQAAQGFTTPTFSFNLPSPVGATEEVNEKLAQRFVDLLTAEKKAFKPCVSFGQDNNLVYATVPATSTQGAIKLEDKAKQAVGGVQLVRLSFPPSCDLELVKRVIAESVAAIYA